MEAARSVIDSRNLLLRIAHGYGYGDGKTTLSCAGKGALADHRGSSVEIGVGQNDGVVLGSALALHALAIGGRARVDVLRDGGGADEADGANLGMVEDGVHCFASSVDEADNALGQVQALEQAEGELHGERDLFRRLQQKTVAAGDGVGQVPEGNHRRKIEGRDGRDDADGLSDHRLVDSRRDVFQVVTLHEHGNAAGDLDVLDCAADFALGFRERLAVLHHDRAGEFVDVIFEELLEGEEILHAIARRRAPPLVLDAVSGSDGVVDLGGRGEWNASDDFVGRWIDDALGWGGALAPFAVDVVQGVGNIRWCGSGHGSSSSLVRR